jgi:hypothetical protein
MPLPHRYIKQILRADDRGGRKAASRMSQRTVARGVMRTLRGRRRRRHGVLTQMIATNGREDVPVPGDVAVVVPHLLSAVWSVLAQAIRQAVGTHSSCRQRFATTAN